MQNTKIHEFEISGFWKRMREWKTLTVYAQRTCDYGNNLELKGLFLFFVILNLSFVIVNIND